MARLSFSLDSLQMITKKFNFSPSALGGGATPKAATGLSECEGSGWSEQRNGGSADRLPLLAGGNAHHKIIFQPR